MADPAAPADPPRTALISITSSKPAVPTLSIVANSGFHDIVKQTITLAAGDRLRLRGQVEWTNDFASAVAGVAELRINGEIAAPLTTQNNLQLGTHHTALYQSAVFTAPTDGAYTIALRFAANRGGASPAVTIEAAEYSQLVVEHYRTFASAAATEEAGAYLLRTFAVDRETLVTSYGETASALTSIYELDLEPRRGDVVRLSAQTTSRWSGPQAAVPHDMHGSGIHVRGAVNERVGAWATENTPWDVNVTPLWTDAVHVVSDDNAYRYVATMHGVSGQGNIVEGTAGHLAALVFTPAGPADGTPRWALAASDSVARDADVVHVANSPMLTVVTRQLDVAAGTVLRLEGTLQLAYVSGVQNPSCRAALVVTDPAGARMAEAVASKYLTPALAGIALRTELVLGLANPGTYRVDLELRCLRSGENTGIRVVGGGGRIVADSFVQVDDPSVR